MKTINAAIKVASTLVLLMRVACGPKASSTPHALPASSVGALTDAPVKKAWEVEWEGVIKAAQREGVLKVYGGIVGTSRDALISDFKTNYGINIEMVTAGGSELVTKILSERRAGLYTIDAYLGGASTMIDPLKPSGVFSKLDSILILPDITDPEKIRNIWWGGQLLWVDSDHNILASNGGSQTPVAINTDLVKREEMKSYQDLLNPKWKGKMVMKDPTTGGFGQKWVTSAGPSLLGWDYMRQLAGQEPALIRDDRILVEWVAHGKYAIVICPKPEVVTEFTQLGAPIAIHSPKGGSGISTNVSNVALMNKAPHPSAAKLFINWLFARETQSIWSKAALYPSLKLDVPTEGIDPQRLLYRDPNEKHVLVDTEEFYRGFPEARKQAEDIFGPLVK